MQDTQATLAKTLSFANHLAVVVGMEPGARAIPGHDKDDVPTVGSGRELDEVVQSREVGLNAVVEQLVSRVPGRRCE